MNNFFGFNPLAIFVVAFCTSLSQYCGGGWVLGLTIGLGIMITLDITPRIINFFIK